MQKLRAIFCFLFFFGNIFLCKIFGFDRSIIHWDIVLAELSWRDEFEFEFEFSIGSRHTHFSGQIFCEFKIFDVDFFSGFDVVVVDSVDVVVVVVVDGVVV